jgi:hypothetical protein
MRQRDALFIRRGNALGYSFNPPPNPNHLSLTSL